ncbi:MAG: TrkA family potassium uptake protein [Cytophagaceae bacterium]|nr:TrkA family potassium uptake protein [Cytophagaceae bacterium]MBK9936575.1 TrkA family potassium uptake protein [Cytophagaceae bacterium]MBL0300329.1 TrkA family potassium uptake protein [Cytophagaceae bacterium]MBL0327261.1 TrkA family potassium uptake protein [Cytophagaceae bacterium]
MRYIVVGLGNFGSTLAMRLTSMGHEVFGVDSRFDVVDQYKDKITHTISIDSTKAKSYNSLPIKDIDVVIIAIGEDVGASIITTALMKQHNAKQIIGRSINPVHRTVLESIGIETIFNPEEIAAEMFAKQLEMRGVVESFDLADNCSIIEIEVPERYLGRQISSINFDQKYDLKLIAIKRFEEKKNFLGMKSNKSVVDIHVDENHILSEQDILVMMGELKNFENMLGKDLRD